MTDDSLPRTRRAALKIGVAAMALLGLGATQAQARSSRASVAYQDSPNGRERCSNCMYFESPNVCSAVSGPVSPRGWCNIWSG